MAVQPSQTFFDRMIRDVSRDRLPPGSCWNLRDMIPGEIDAPAAKRGGTVYVSPAALQSGADRIAGIIYAPFFGGAQLLVCSREDNAPANNALYQINSVSSATQRDPGTPIPLVGENPTFYRNKVYFAGTENADVLVAYDGTNNVAVVAGTPPTAARASVYKDHLVLARSNSSGNLTNRVWFSAAGDPTSWDTTNGFIDTSGTVHCMYALRNALLVFHGGSLERIIGSIPPPGSDMSLQPVWDVGCDQPYSLAGTDQFVVFANSTGLFRTDGTEVVDLAKQGGMSSYWRTRFALGAGRVVAGGYAWGWYFCTISDANPLGAFIDAFMVHVDTRRWIRLNNLTANCFARRTADVEELYVGDFSVPRAHGMSDIFRPAAGNKNDADGAAVLPIVEGHFGPPSVGPQRFKNLFVTYDMRDAASDHPVMTLSTVTSPESTSYTAVVGEDGNAYPLPEQTEQKRVKRFIRKQTAGGIGWKLEQTVASAQTRIYRVDVDTEMMDPARV